MQDYEQQHHGDMQGGAEMTPEEREAERQHLEATLNAMGQKLHRLAHEQVAARQQIETRWLKDLRQYHGEYTADELGRMRSANSSQVYVNISRNKTRAAIARLSDMLLPNDDRNFGLKPTPVPSTSKANDPMRPDTYQPLGVPPQQPGAQQLNEMGEPLQMPPEMQQQPEMPPIDVLEEYARNMQRQIEDDFTEASYNALIRDVIDDACKMGAGVLKGPTIVNRSRRAWVTDPNTGQSVLEIQQELRPGLERVDPWDFFPDMSATDIREAEFVFERKLVNRKQLRELAGLPGVIASQLRIALEDENGQSIAQDRRSELRAITGVDTVISESRWELWEYWGPLDKDELRSAGADIEDDPLVEYTGTVLMVGQHVIKAAINPLDTDDLPYSVFNWETDRSSIFGFGVPYLMRHAQRVVNASWRMMMDNAGLSSGPQVIVNKRSITPADGDWTIRPRKVWYATGDAPVDSAFSVLSIASNQSDLFSIFQAAQQLADTETNLPILMQGEGMSGGPGARTATGMQMLMNNSNIVLRSAVKNFDDGITETVVRRFYDYHMLYTDRPEIKGDFDIQARGSSVLVAREEQQEKLLMLSQVAGGNPLFAQMTDWTGLYKEILRSMQVPVDSIVISDEEMEQQSAASEGEEGPPPEMQLKMAELKLKEQIAFAQAQQDQSEMQMKQQQQQWEQQYKAAELQTRQEEKMAELALKEGITMAQLETKLQLESSRLEMDMQKTAQQLQNDRDKTAATITERQNDRQARRNNMSLGYDSYG